MYHYEWTVAGMRQASPPTPAPPSTLEELGFGCLMVKSPSLLRDMRSPSLDKAVCLDAGGAATRPPSPELRAALAQTRPPSPESLTR